MERSEETRAINERLEIVELVDCHFKIDSLRGVIVNGYVLRHPEFGFLGFRGEEEPYTPLGGEQALKEILQEGGMTSYDDIVWWN